ncbi:MAG: hypothetical protein ACJAWV_001317 [Flammeovirgaceae bacterium]|jgi:hypothetical protein
MPILNRIKFLFLVFLVGLSGFATAQYKISGIITEKISKETLPFTHIIINKGENHAFADIGGKFSVESSKPIHTLTFKKDLHQLLELEVDRFKKSVLLKVEMTQNSVFTYAKETDMKSFTLMQKVFAEKETYNPMNFTDFSYKSYNKFTLDYGKVEKVHSMVNGFLKKLKFVDKFLKYTLFDNQHLFMMESETNRNYFNDENHKEYVLASKVSGIEKPTIFALTSQLQPFSIYEPEVSLLGSNYFGPFTKKPFHWYRFEIVNTAFVKSDTVYTVKFNPKNENRIQFLKGYLYINSDGYVVNYHEVSPAIEPKISTRYLESYQKDSSGKWIPNRITTGVVRNQISTTSGKVEAFNRTQIHDIQHNVGLKKSEFDEIALTYENTERKSGDYWHEFRKIPFTEADSLTYLYYDSVGSVKNFERVIRFGEGLYYGELPFKNVDILLGKVFDVNQFEGIRLGMGMQTNERLWKRTSIGGYFGYGFKDDLWKYGIFSRFTLTKTLNTTLTVSHTNDLLEGAHTEFAFDSPQFSSESQRRFRVLIKDKVIRNEVALEFRPFKFMQMRGGILQDKLTPQYDYSFEPSNNEVYRFGEFRLGMRFAYGEHFMKSVYRKISFGTEWPILWFQIARGYKSFLGGEFDYTKLDAKLQNSVRLVGLGTAHFQLRMGYVLGEVPYSRLYNNLGSFRELAAIARNSFETMGYNEFLSDRHISFFYNHNFGDLHIRKLKKQPSFEMAHNFGVGSLQNPEAHNFDFKTMEQGFFESGIYMNNIFVLSGFGLNIGLGAGIFARYGKYAFEDNSDNFVFKVALELKI